MLHRCLFLIILGLVFPLLKAQENLPPPNILWISWEDVSPNFGCYGDTYAHTPNIDQLAKEGVLFTNAFSHSGVCSPSRAGIITGMYPTSIGSHHMRCQGVPPPEVRLFPELLRRAGYYCTNDVKTDYQMSFAGEAIWDELGRGVRWHKREKDQPFFSVINFTQTHEGQIYAESDFWDKELAALGKYRHDPSKAPLPPYFPENEIIQKDFARYYDNMTVTDKLSGEILRQLEKEGLAENTIVFFWGDHGAGLTRAKRWIYDSGLKIPLIVRVPEKYRSLLRPDNPGALSPGTVNDELVAFVDFAPTILSVCGVKIPEFIQGQAFLGPQRAENSREYIYAARDRMDEVYDMIRGVRDHRYKYIRNYMPHLGYAQVLRTMERMPTMQELRRLHAAGKLKGPETLFFRERKPIEELYDTQTDPHEIHNLADDPKYREILQRMRKVHEAWRVETGDIGLVPEGELDKIRWPDGFWQTTAKPVFQPGPQTFVDGRTMVTITCPTPGSTILFRRKNQTGWNLYTEPLRTGPDDIWVAKAVRLGYYDSDEVSYRLGDPVASPEKVTWTHWKEKIFTGDRMQRLFEIKDLDLRGETALNEYMKLIQDADPLVRFWAVTGLYTHSNSSKQKKAALPILMGMLEDDSEVIQIQAAYALGMWGNNEGIPVLRNALEHPLEGVRLPAILALDNLGDMAKAAMPLPAIPPGTENQYTNRVILRMLAKWGM